MAPKLAELPLWRADITDMKERQKQQISNVAIELLRLTVCIPLPTLLSDRAISMVLPTLKEAVAHHALAEQEK